MRAVFALVLVAGMALAGIAVYLAQSYVGQSQAEVARAQELQQKTGELVEVYAVNKALSFGDPLTPDDVELVYIQASFLPTGAYRLPAEGEVIDYNAAAAANAAENAIQMPTSPLFPENADKPRYLKRPMEPHEIVLASRLTEPGQVASLTGKLDKGMRAFQISVTSSMGVADFVTPENYIDIYWTGSDEINGDITKLIESAVRVIAVDQMSGAGQVTVGNAKTVTVAATPEQVGRLAQAQATGRLSMALVASSADAGGAVEISNVDILGKEAPVIVPVEAEKTCSIKSGMGATAVETIIPCTN